MPTNEEMMIELTKLQKMYTDLSNRHEATKKENDLFKQKTQIVGVRWYGKGGFGIGLNYMVNGVNRVALEGYGATGIIDYSSWIRVRTTEECRNGILVRDDAVVKEAGLDGMIGSFGPFDRFTNPNAYTDLEILPILKGRIDELKKVVKGFTHHFVARHFLQVSLDNKVKDQTKIHIIKDRYFELFVRFKNGLLLYHDLTLACELNNIKHFDEMTSAEMIEKLSILELENTDKSYVDDID